MHNVVNHISFHIYIRSIPCTVFDNPHLFIHFTTPAYLPYMTLANGLKTIAKVVGTAKPLLFVPLEFVLCIPHCPFNLVHMLQIVQSPLILLVLLFMIAIQDK